MAQAQDDNTTHATDTIPAPQANMRLKDNHDRHYQGEASLGYAMAVGEFGRDRLSIETKHGVRWNPYIYSGLGFGIHYYASGPKSWTLPVFANIKGYLLDKVVTPYLSMDMGYSFGFSEMKGTGGFYISPAIGANFFIDASSSFILELGYQSQSFKVRRHGRINMGALSIKLGFTFF